jgi:TonB-dependent starch-binding outer membrane protein SusC
VLDDGLPLNSGDIDHIGNPFPKFSYGLTANITYKNFDLSIFVQGVYGNKIWALWQGEFERPTQYWQGFQRAYTDAWRGAGTSNYFPELDLNYADANNNYRSSSWYVHDGSYLRLKNAQIGYTIPRTYLKHVGISSFRLFLGGTNLFTITKYPGIDPENGDPDPKIFGLDNITVRIPKMFNFNS